MRFVWIALATVITASVTELDFESLTSEVIPESLTEDGVLILRRAIDSDKVALLAAKLVECAESSGKDPQHLVSRINSDGSLRSTLASRSNEAFTQCGPDVQDLAGYFKDQTQLIGETFASILDEAFPNPTTASTLREFVGDSRSGSLDHFHIYTPSESSGSDISESSIPFHFDMGLFLVLTPEMWMDSNGRRSDLFIKRPDGSVYPVIPSEDDSVIILIGSGITHWLNPAAPLAPALHGVASMKASSGSKRVVLGRMFLAPPETVSADGVKFINFFETPIRGPESADPSEQRWRRLAQRECAADEKYCWMNCMKLPDCGGDEAVCKDPSDNHLCGPNECNTKCKLMCPERPAVLITPAPVQRTVAPPVPVVPVGRRNSESPQSTVSPTSEPVTVEPKDASPSGMTAMGGGVVNDEKPFCYGATSMVMSGFESVGTEDANCIILFFRPWILDTPLKFAFGCIGVFLLGLFIEAAIKFRRQVTNEAKFDRAWVREAAVVSLFALNVALGYMAMLAAMTFNVEIFLSTVMGIAIGHLLFGNSKQPVRETADPCCVTTEANPEVRTGLRNSTGACCCEN